MNNQNSPNSFVWQSTGVGAFGGFCVGYAAGRFFGLDAVASGIAGMGICSILAHTYTITVVARPQMPRRVEIDRYSHEVDIVRTMTTENEDFPHGTFGDWPVERRRVIKLARGLADGFPFTEAQWTGPRQPFTVREFSQIRTMMINSKWAAWRGATPQRGCLITSAGRAVMRYYATHPRERRAAENRAAVLGRV